MRWSGHEMVNNNTPVQRTKLILARIRVRPKQNWNKVVKEGIIPINLTKMK